MKDTDFAKRIELVNVGGGFIPHNQIAQELLDRTAKGEVLTFEEVTSRDLTFHRFYFALLSFIYDYMPNVFKKEVNKDEFYLYLKHVRGDYKVKHVFKELPPMIEYVSISFGKMSQKQFEEFIADQLPFIYSNILGAYFEMDMLNGIIETIEKEFQNMLKKLP